MRVGFLSSYDPERIAFAHANGCESIGLIVKAGDPLLPSASDWKEVAAEVRGEFAAVGMTLSSVGGMYGNILDPAQAGELTKLFRATVELAVELGTRVVGCFAGRVMGRPLEQSLPAFTQTWGELAKYCAGLGVRIAFENCPQGAFHQPPDGFNFFCTPEMWECGFNELPDDNVGLQWDPSHLVCQFIDPVENLKRFGKKVFHVHAKDAKIDRTNLARYGLWHPATMAHRFPGLGDSDWTAIVRELKAQGYDASLDIEGWHDPVYHGAREDEGLLIGIRHLKRALSEAQKR